MVDDLPIDVWAMRKMTNREFLPADRLHNLPVHVGQSEMPALKFEGQPLVVDTQALQDRGVQVADMNRILDDIVAEIVGGAVEMIPGLIPPPAIQMVKQRGWWSRP